MSEKDDESLSILDAPEPVLQAYLARTGQTKEELKADIERNRALYKELVEQDFPEPTEAEKEKWLSNPGFTTD